MRVSNWQLVKLAPVVLRESRDNPCREWEELLSACVDSARRRGMIELLASLERAGAVQSEGPAAAGPSAVEREAED